MGLDMLLTKKTYVKNWDFMQPEDRHEVTVKRNGQDVEDIKPERVAYIEETIATWRKANAIHKWFVERVQDGNDDCRDYWVGRDKLRELLETVETVLTASKLIAGQVYNGTRYTDGKAQDIMEDGMVIEDASVARDLLPTTSGFFFGSTDYDQYYYDDLTYTKQALEDALRETQGEFYYSSSW